MACIDASDADAVDDTAAAGDAADVDICQTMIDVTTDTRCTTVMLMRMDGMDRNV